MRCVRPVGKPQARSLLVPVGLDDRRRVATGIILVIAIIAGRVTIRITVGRTVIRSILDGIPIAVDRVVRAASIAVAMLVQVFDGVVELGLLVGRELVAGEGRTGITDEQIF